MPLLKKCPKCSTYTFKDNCPKCKTPNKTPTPTIDPQYKFRERFVKREQE